MSRPLTIVPFASTINYPAGANIWNGLATKLANGAGYFTPGLAATAPEINYQINRTDAAVAAITDHAGQIAAQNWRPGVTRGGGALGGETFGDQAYYDTFYHRWLMPRGYGAGTGTAKLLAQSIDGGDTWTTVIDTGAPTGNGAANSGTVFAVATRPSDGKIAVLTDGNPTLSAPFANFGTFSNGHLFWSTRVSKMIIIGRNNVGAQVFATSADLSSTSSPTFPAITNGALTLRYFAAESPTTIVVASHYTGTQTIVTSTDAGAATWTLQAISSLTVSEYIVGLVYSGGQFVCALSNGTNSRVVTSPDGVTWTEVANLTTMRMLNLAAQGAGLAAVAVFNTFNRYVTSKDGGVTWQFGAAGQLLAGASTANIDLVCSGAQFLSYTVTTSQGSLTCGTTYMSAFKAPRHQRL